MKPERKRKFHVINKQPIEVFMNPNGPSECAYLSQVFNGQILREKASSEISLCLFGNQTVKGLSTK